MYIYSFFGVTVVRGDIRKAVFFKSYVMCSMSIHKYIYILICLIYIYIYLWISGI